MVLLSRKLDVQAGENYIWINFDSVPEFPPYFFHLLKIKIEKRLRIESCLKVMVKDYPVTIIYHRITYVILYYNTYYKRLKINVKI